MRYAKYIFALLFCIVIGNSTVHAVGVTDPPEPTYYSPVFITALQFGSSRLDAIELYNDSSMPIELSTWSIHYLSAIGGQECVMQLRDFLLPDSYVVAVSASTPLTDESNVLRYDDCGRDAVSSSILLYNGSELQEIVKPETTFVAIRKGVTKNQRSGKFGTDFVVPEALKVPEVPRAFYAGEYYRPPAFNQLQVTEILPNSRNCSPLEAALDCADYVKVYNPTLDNIDLSLYRLRNGYLGQTSTSSNTFSLSGILQPGHYAVLPVNITNSGGWIWFEDENGVKRYDNTVSEYPDASADSKKGSAWAYDESSGIWKWTTQPMPYDSPSVFPVPAVEKPKIITTLVPCKEDQYRSEETNRCRSLAVASDMTPCKEGQYRSEETNRCRSVVAALASLVPCKEGQERNPDTSRCRNVVSSAPNSAFAVEPILETGKAFTGWWALGGVGVLAAGRGVWEWRSEMLAGIRKLGSFFTSNK